jgi:hypothetical protein
VARLCGCGGSGILATGCCTMSWSDSRAEDVCCMSDPLDRPLDQTEREMLGLGRDITYNYRCSRCQHEDAVPDVVISGFAASAGLTRGRMPHLVCPECGGPFRAVGDGRRGRRRR